MAAAPITTPSIGDITPLPDDISVWLLSSILGPNWQNLIVPGTTPTEAGGALGAMLGMVNMLGIMILVITMSYTVFQAATGTAYEGVPLGKKLHTFYTPVRGVIGLGLLIPLPWAGGLNLLQALVLLFTWYGIGIADATMGVGLDYAKANLGMLVAPTLAKEDRGLSRNALGTLTAVQFMAQRKELRIGGGEWNIDWTLVKDDKVQSPYEVVDKVGKGMWDTFVDKFMTSTGLETDINAERKAATQVWQMQVKNLPKSSGLVAADFGVLEIICLNKAPYDKVCDQRKRAIETYLYAVNNTATGIVAQLPRGTGGTIPQGNLSKAEAALAQTLRQLAVAELKGLNGGLNDRLNRFINDIKKNGWIALFSYHLALGEFQAESAAALNMRVTSKGPSWSEIATQVTDKAGFYTAQKMMSGVLGVDALTDTPNAMKNAAHGVQADEDDGLGILMEMISEALAGFGDFVIADSLMKGDPVAGLKGLGDTVIGLAEILLGVDVALSGYNSFAGALGALADSVDDEDAAKDKTAKGAKKEGKLGKFMGALKIQFGPMLSTFLATILMALLITGFILAYYLPMVPFIIGWLGVVGWVVLVMESLAATFLWGFAHALTEGEGFVGHRAQQGYMLFLNVLFRPVLMVIGFFMSLLLFYALAIPTGVMLKIAWGGTTHGFQFIFGTAAYLIIFCIIVIQIAHKLFGLIVWIPDNLLRWIGSHGASFGEAQTAGGAEGKMVAGMAAFSRVTQVGRPKMPGAGGNSPSTTQDMHKAGEAPDNGEKPTLAPAPRPDDNSGR